MRLAVSRAIDLQTIDALTGKGEPQSSIPSAIFTEWTTYLDEQSVVERWHSYDPEMAKRLLAEVGYPDGFDTVMRIPENASPYWLSMAEVVSKMLNEVGISATLEGVPSAEHRFTPADRGIKFAQVQDFDGDARAFLREHFAAGRNYNYSRTDVAVPELDPDRPDSIVPTQLLLLEEMFYIPMPAPMYARSGRVHGPLTIQDTTDIGRTLKEVWIEE